MRKHLPLLWLMKRGQSVCGSKCGLLWLAYLGHGRNSNFKVYCSPVCVRVALYGPFPWLYHTKSTKPLKYPQKPPSSLDLFNKYLSRSLTSWLQTSHLKTITHSTYLQPSTSMMDALCWGWVELIFILVWLGSTFFQYLTSPIFKILLHIIDVPARKVKLWKFFLCH